MHVNIIILPRYFIDAILTCNMNTKHVFIYLWLMGYKLSDQTYILSC